MLVDTPMASKGITFFALGTLFGGLCAATIAFSLPSKASRAKKGSTTATKVVTKVGKTKIVQVTAPCPVPGKNSVLAALAQNIARGDGEKGSNPARHFADAAKDEDQEEVEDTEWTPEMEKEFVEREKALYQERLDQINKMRQDLIQEAGLNKSEQLAFDSVVKEVTEKLRAGEQKLEAMMGPLPELDPSKGGQDEGDMPAIPELPRKALLENELNQTKALLHAQTRFEEILGKDRLKALGPRFNSVEMFIADGPPPETTMPEQEQIK